MSERRPRSRAARAWILFSVTFTVTVLLFVAANFVAWVTMPAKEIVVEPAVEAALADAYPELSAEERREIVQSMGTPLGLEVVAQYREHPLRSRFVNMDEAGFRHVADQGPWPPSPDHYNVFFFGGSTAFGKGVRDEDTVASRLQELLGTVDGKPVKVYNFARGGFYSSQERLLFDELATLGQRPDAAVFLDGLNDFFFEVDPPPFTLTATDDARRRIDEPWSALVRRLPLLARLAPVPLDLRRTHELLRGHGEAPASEEEAIDGVIRRYLANKRVIEAIGRAHGIETVFVWQPVPTYGYAHPPPGDASGHAMSAPGYREMRSRVRRDPPGGTFVWCADIQEDLEGNLYVDGVHYDPDMSRELARCIAEAFPRPSS